MNLHIHRPGAGPGPPARNKKARPRFRRAGRRAGRTRPTGQRTSSGAITTLMTDISLIRMFRLGPDVSLNGSPHRIAHDGGLVGLAALAAEVASLDVLLGVVPGAAGVGLEQGQQHAAGGHARQQAAQHLGAAQEADRDRSHDRQQAGHDHLLDRRRGRDVHAAPEVGDGGSLHQAGDLLELAAHLLDHREGGAADGIHGEAGEQERQHRAEQQSHQHGRHQQVDLLQVHDVLVGAEHGQGGQRGRTDREALADGRGGVAHGVQLVGARAHLGAETGPSR